MNYALDACALLAFLYNEPGSDAIEELLNRSKTGDIFLSMSIVNLLEVYYVELREKGMDIAQTVLDAVHYYSIQIVSDISWQIFHEAARLKASYSISLGDALGLATAVEQSAQFVSSDHHELEALEDQETVQIRWFR
jgi:PIN domain nuclease of toxin-antitoxin system